MRLFHYHLVTRRIRDVEARYIAKLGFDLVARHGRIGEDAVSFEAGVPWHELDRMGFKLRLAELQLRTDDPMGKAVALADLLDLPAAAEAVIEIGDTVVR